MQVLKDFETTINRKVALANIYSEWEYLANKNVLEDLNTLSRNGWVPIVSSNPSFIKKCKDNGKSLYKTIASGECDEFLRHVARNLRQYNKPLFLRFAWEMNLPDMHWSVNKTKSQQNNVPFYLVNKLQCSEKVKNIYSSSNTTHYCIY